MNQKTTVLSNKLLRIEAWFLGIVFFIIGLSTISSTPVAAILLIIIALLLLPPVTRFIKNKWNISLSRKMRVGISIFLLIISVVIFIVNAPPEAQTTVVMAPTDATSTPQGQIEEIADNAAPGMTNESNENHLRSVSVMEDPQGGWDVNVQLNSDDNLTENLTKTGVLSQISDEFIALYNGTSSISSVSVEAFMQLTDKYGNTKDGMVYSATLDKATASQVNWNNDKSLLELSILPGVWQTDYDLFSVNQNL